MKAIVARDFAPLESLEYADWPEPVAGPGEVVIAAEAIGVNFPDGLLVQGLYQMKPEPPFVPGMEMAGPVVAVGEGVTSPKVGDRVAALGHARCLCREDVGFGQIRLPAARWRFLRGCLRADVRLWYLPLWRSSKGASCSPARRCA